MDLSTLHFVWPLMLLLLLLLPLLVGGYLLAQRRRQRYTVRFTNLDLLANVVKESPGWKRHVPPVVTLLALTALIVALARPELEERVPKERASVMLATDSSGSMQATDVNPNRLVAAQRASREFAEALPKKFQLGLVSFDQAARLLVPPTTDRSAVRRGIDQLVAQGGTAMGDAMDQSLRALRPLIRRRPGESRRPPAVIVLMSDGENTSGYAKPDDVAREAKRLGIPINTVALGTPQGTVDVPDASGIVQTISVPPNKEALKQIARDSGGKFFDAPSSGELASVYEALGTRIGFVKQEQEVAWLPAAAGVILLIAGAGLSLVWFGRIP